MRIVEPPEWDRASPPDVYFTRAYHLVAAASEPDSRGPILLRWSDGRGVVHLPLILRAIPNTQYFDATSAYGYGGPWIDGSPDPIRFWDALNRWARDHRVISTFLRLHPQLDNASWLGKSADLTIVGPTAEWRTDPGRDLRASMSKSHRKTVNTAVRSGVTAHVSEHPSSLQDFRALYESTMDRVGAQDYYVFPDAYWRSLESHSEALGLLQVDSILEGVRVASALILSREPFAHFHLSGTTSAARDVGAAHLARLAAAEWAQVRGYSRLHFGGGLGGAQSSLLSWKTRFDPATPLLEFSVAKLVHDDTTYDTLARGYERSDYFPPWRAN